MGGIPLSIVFGGSEWCEQAATNNGYRVIKTVAKTIRSLVRILPPPVNLSTWKLTVGWYTVSGNDAGCCPIDRKENQRQNKHGTLVMRFSLGAHSLNVQNFFPYNWILPRGLEPLGEKIVGGNFES